MIVTHGDPTGLTDITVVGADFTPYVSAGHWTYDDDYVWVSDYDWGWLAFHFGRWFMYDDDRADHDHRQGGRYDWLTEPPQHPTQADHHIQQ